jgi:NhaA family Na+:H+ antiporter
VPTLLFTRPSLPRSREVAAALRTETVGGTLLLAAAALAVVLANSPWGGGYERLLATPVGPESLHLHLTLREWAADGLLAVFFLVAGVELVQELVDGDLRDPAKAAVPVVAARAGVALPAVLYLLVTAGDPGARAGWAIPVATDIAFALAVLAVVGRHLPGALRAFLLTLAVVDDVVAITIIAVAYTDRLSWTPLLAAVVPLAAFAAVARSRFPRWWLLAPLGVLTWALVHASGVHATVAGVLLGVVLPVRPRRGARSSVAQLVEHRLRPLSAGVAVPLFALGAAGVRLDGDALRSALADPVVPGVVVALVAGKAIGVFGGTWLIARLTRARLDDDLRWADVAGVSLLAGVGFTVSLLVGDLAFGTDGPRAEHVRLAVLAGSAIAATLATLVLRRRNAAYRAGTPSSGSEPRP